MVDKYQEALQRAKEVHDSPDESPALKKMLEGIFPDLIESEDEKIRKDIIGGLMWQRDNLKSEGPHDNNLILPGFCLTVGEHLAYFEKQKVQPTDTKTGRVIKAARRVLNNWLDDTDCPDVSGDFAELEYAIREYDGEEKQKEQKPSTEETELNSIAFLEQMGYTCIPPKEQKPAEDELVYRLNGLMQNYIKEGKDEAEKEHRLKCYRLFWDALEDTNFFEQKEQKPVEWSEEDEKMLRTIISDGSRGVELDSKQIDFLKSLRSQPHWKPSEEQMKAMEEVRTIFHHHHLWDEINPILYDYEELMRDLKKLILNTRKEE